MTANPPRDRSPPPAGEQPPWPPIQALESSGPPPDRRPPLRPRRILLAAFVALGVGALLGSGALVGLAERQPVGTQRDVALGAANVTDRVAHLLSLNRPAERLAAAVDGEQEVYDVEALLARARARVPTPQVAGDDGTATGEPTDPSEPIQPSEPTGSAEEETGDDAGPPAEGFDEEETGDDAGPPAEGFDEEVGPVDCIPATETEPATTTTSEQGDPPEVDTGEAPDASGCPPGFMPAGVVGEMATPSPPEEPADPPQILFDAPRTPNEDEPLAMYVGGDSISRDLGEGLARITPTTLVRIDLDPQPATGLSRPDFFDWAQHLAGVLTEGRPDVIVVLFGANDFQNVEYEGEILDRFGSEWLDLYRQRVDRIMTLLGQPGTQTVWVGQPPVREPRLSGGLAILNDVYAEQAAEHPQVSYVDAWELFSDSDGDYVDEIDGVRLRREDGVHLTIDGGNRLAEAVWDLVAPAWGLE